MSLELVTLKNKIGLDGSGELSENCRFVSSNGSCLFPLRAAGACRLQEAWNQDVQMYM